MNIAAPAEGIAILIGSNPGKRRLPPERYRLSPGIFQALRDALIPRLNIRGAREFQKCGYWMFLGRSRGILLCHGLVHQRGKHKQKAGDAQYKNAESSSRAHTPAPSIMNFRSVYPAGAKESLLF